MRKQKRLVGITVNPERYEHTELCTSAEFCTRHRNELNYRLFPQTKWNLKRLWLRESRLQRTTCGQKLLYKNLLYWQCFDSGMTSVFLYAIIPNAQYAHSLLPHRCWSCMLHWCGEQTVSIDRHFSGLSCVTLVTWGNVWGVCTRTSFITTTTLRGHYVGYCWKSVASWHSVTVWW